VIYPEGIVYNKKKDLVRSPGINSIVAPIPQLARILKSNKKSRFDISGLAFQEAGPANLALHDILKDFQRMEIFKISTT
jgi:hypothetical protein